MDEYKCLGGGFVWMGLLEYVVDCGFSCRQSVDSSIPSGIDILCLRSRFLLAFHQELPVSTVPKFGTLQVV